VEPACLKLHRLIYPPLTALGGGTQQLCSHPAAASFLLVYATLMAVAVIPLQVGPAGRARLAPGPAEGAAGGGGVHTQPYGVVRPDAVQRAVGRAPLAHSSQWQGPAAAAAHAPELPAPQPLQCRQGAAARRALHRTTDQSPSCAQPPPARPRSRPTQLTYWTEFNSKQAFVRAQRIQLGPSWRQQMQAHSSLLAPLVYTWAWSAITWAVLGMLQTSLA
jgi:hypothetical protein